MSGSKVTWAKCFMRSIITLLRDNICPDQTLFWQIYAINNYITSWLNGLNFMRSIITLLRDNICPDQKLLGLNILCDQ